MCEDVADVLEHRACLHADVEQRLPGRVMACAGDRVVGTSRAGAGYEDELARTAKMRISAARPGLAWDDTARGSSVACARSCARRDALSLCCCNHGPPLQLDADVHWLGKERERMGTALAADPGELHSAEGRAQIPQEPVIHPRDADLHRARHPMSALQVRG